MKKYQLLQTIKEMIELVIIIQEQAQDNPELAEKILGKSIVNQASKIYKKLQ